ncbi:ABC transporter ATP-binding protein [Acuticoccus mangrovi]|uniref:ABC transporter ATP-binding protein n=1 Tax=Acuticoccus mangrovi TaxID=2796142 RepID=A0A934ISS1_9HYPH|nr:ATP-binding cassette domain-containing protein [Acuticoccus mangrovi]MBJ3778055.1 ABC transporter ATP-binding protein [Acuticoccus mangrovi]
MRLTVEELSVHAGSTRLVGPISLAIEAGEPLTILGETGAGKSLLAQAIMGALPEGLTAQGAITLDGRRLDTLPPRQRRALWGHEIAMLPQEPWRALDALMRSGEQVAESHAIVAGEGWKTAEARAHDALSGLGLEERAMAAWPGALSGGMAQRVAFAAATAAGAGTLLADEPTKGLDEARRDDVTALLLRYVEDGHLLLTITHDVAVARALGGKVMVLKDGEAVEHGAAAEVLHAPKSAYGQALIAADPANWPHIIPQRGGEPVLVAEGLGIARGRRLLLDGVGLSLRAGQRIAVVGESGLGKSSLLDTLAGLIPAAGGAVRRLGRGAAPFAVQKLYQDPPAAFAPRVPLAESFRDLERRHRISRAEREMLLERLGLSPGLLARRPDAVSGGELQRLALVRVLLLQPAVILADEPTSRLDPVTQRQVMEVIGAIARQSNVGLVLVTHNRTMARRWADSTLDLSDYTPLRAAG